VQKDFDDNLPKVEEKVTKEGVISGEETIDKDGIDNTTIKVKATEAQNEDTSIGHNSPPPKAVKYII
jgi:hypothetical protein